MTPWHHDLGSTHPKTCLDVRPVPAGEKLTLLQRVVVGPGYTYRSHGEQVFLSGWEAGERLISCVNGPGTRDHSACLPGGAGVPDV